MNYGLNGNSVVGPTERRKTLTPDEIRQQIEDIRAKEYSQHENTPPIGFRFGEQTDESREITRVFNKLEVLSRLAGEAADKGYEDCVAQARLVEQKLICDLSVSVLDRRFPEQRQKTKYGAIINWIASYAKDRWPDIQSRLDSSRRQVDGRGVSPQQAPNETYVVQEGAA